MKITIVQGAFLPVPPVAGGAVEKLWFDLGREFARRGLVVTHISRRWPGLPLNGEVDGVVQCRVAGFDYPGSGVLAKMRDFIYSVRCLTAIERSDVIVTNTFFLPLLLTLLPRRGAVYVSVHRFPQGQMKFYRRADRLQCVSSMIANAVRSQSPSVAALVKVVPNYVASRLTKQQLADGWGHRRPEILFVGRVHPEKGIDLLLQAVATIAPAARAGWSLRIVGPHASAAGGGGDAFLAALKGEANRLALDVDWVGPVYDREALNQAYRRAGVFVYPSTAAKGEAFPLAPLEAMAQGCAVVTSDLDCFSDFARPGENAEMFALAAPDVPAALGTAIASLIGSDARRRAHAAAGLTTVERFSLDRVADAFVDDFASLTTP